MEYNTIGRRIKKLRRDKELTQTEFAKLVGTSQSVVWRWEEGSIKSLKGKNIDRICEVLGCKREYLIYGIEERSGLPKVIEDWIYDPDNRSKVIMFVKDEKIKEVEDEINGEINNMEKDATK